jgi:L-arabinose transport system substrate-binding protein
MMMKKILGAMAVSAFALCAVTGVASAADKVKMGFVVKQAEEPWFIDEWKFADAAAELEGFQVVKIGAEDGEKVMAAIDNLGAQGAQGMIICTPDVKLGPAIAAAAQRNKLKLMTVDDRLIDAAGKPIEAVPHMGISALKIGEQVGKAIAEEIKKRGWKMEEVGAIRVTYDELPTAVDRVTGATTVLVQNGFPEKNIYNAAQRKTNTEEAFNAANIVVTKQPNVKKWIAYGLNDEAALGAVRALEGNGFKAEDIVAVGIGGSDSALNEFKKAQLTGFFGTVIISPKRHGYETAMNMLAWIKDNKEPEKLTLTAGVLANRANVADVRKSLGLE